MHPLIQQSNPQTKQFKIPPSLFDLGSYEIIDGQGANGPLRLAAAILPD